MYSARTYRYWLMGCLVFLFSLPSWAAGGSAVAGPVEFSFYGEPLQAARMHTVEVPSVREHDVFKAWHAYQDHDVNTALGSLRMLSDQLGLNDWLNFELIRCYADELLRESSPIDRVLLEHYLLVAMGYDVRLARTERQLLLLVPFEQEVYERYFIKIGDKDYYLFFDDLEADLDEKTVIYPCDPSRKVVGQGKCLSLLFDGKPLNVKAGEDKIFNLDDGKIHFSCSVNEAVMNILYNYPLMDIQYYAISVVLPQFHESIIEQLQPQLEDLTQCEAADALLHFVQHVFDYDDDSHFHGRDKYNFIEENFYYEKNDCEDRSILYAFLVHTLLGLDVHFVQYPGHECTAVRFTDCRTYGYGYEYDGDFYLICDPTYVGAGIGKCMPRYRFMTPHVLMMGSTSLNARATTILRPKIDKSILAPDLQLTSSTTDFLMKEDIAD